LIITSLPALKILYDQESENLNEAFKDIYLEEQRSKESIQICKEHIYTLNKILQSIDQKLEEAL